MKLLEAKERLESLREDRKSFLENDTEHDEIFLEDIEAIDTVLQALEDFQEEKELARKSLIENSNIADERNDLLLEVQKLKKENEELKDRNKILENCKYANGFEIKKAKLEEENRWKGKIIDCLDDIEDYFERISVPYEDIEFIKEKRKDLLNWKIM